MNDNRIEKDKLKDILQQLRGGTSTNKKIDNYSIYQVDEGEVTIEIESGEIRDIFKVYPIKIKEEDKSEIMISNLDLRVRYDYSEYIGDERDESKRFVLQSEPYRKEEFSDLDLKDFPTVLRVLMENTETNSVLNHTMGVIFNPRLSKTQLIYSKTIHDDRNNTEDGKENIIMYFGPFILNLLVSEDNITIVKLMK